MTAEKFPQVDDTFGELSEALIDLSSSQRQKYPRKLWKRDKVKSILKRLAYSQKTLKSMDGLTHGLSNTIADKSSLTARYQYFLKYKSKNKKEAAKVMEYIIAVERAMQAANLLQDTSVDDEKKRRKCLLESNVEEIDRFTLQEDGIRLQVSLLRPLNDSSTAVKAPTAAAANDTPLSREMIRKKRSLPRRYEQGELIIVVNEDTTVSFREVLSVLAKESVDIPLKSTGFVSDEVSIHPTFLKLTSQLLNKISTYLPPQRDNSTDLSANSSSHIATAAPYRSLRCIGYSCGGAVAALSSMMLEKSLPISNATALAADLTPFYGLYDRVRCVTIGSPACVSRSIIGRNIISIICGDDIIPRANSHSINKLCDRIQTQLSSTVFQLGTQLLGDMVSVTKDSLMQYTTGSHDLSSLTVPGRVFYVKSRKLKKGASIQRVMRNNWREEMLWLLHDILLSRKMISHHELDYYIQTLNKC